MYIFDGLKNNIDYVLQVRFERQENFKLHKKVEEIIKEERGKSEKNPLFGSYKKGWF